MVICLEQGAHLHMAHLIPLPLTISCFSKIQIGFTFLVPADPGIPGERAVKRVVCVCVFMFLNFTTNLLCCLSVNLANVMVRTRYSILHLRAIVFNKYLCIAFSILKFVNCHSLLSDYCHHWCLKLSTSIWIAWPTMLN